LEKAFVEYQEKVIEWALRRKGIASRMLEADMALYVNSRTRVKAINDMQEYQRSLTS